MTKFCIVSRDEIENAIIQKRIVAFSKLIGEVRFVSARFGSLQDSVDFSSDIIILNIEEFDPKIKYTIQEIRDLGYENPIILIATMPKSIVKFDFLATVALLRRPYEPEEFLGLVRYLRENKEIRFRKYPRFAIKELAQIERYDGGPSFEALIVNISKGGILIKDFKCSIPKGIIVRIRFMLSELNKERVLSARVVWFDYNSKMSGLEFMDQKTVYQYLLRSVG